MGGFVAQEPRAPIESLLDLSSITALSLGSQSRPFKDCGEPESMGSEQRGPSNANTFVIRPNAAPPWRQIRIFFILVASVSLTVAGGFALLGFWPILPFAGLELLLLAWALYTTARRAERREVVRVNEDTVEVERGIRQPEQRWTLQKAWAQVRVVRSRHRLHPSRLLICSHGQQIEIGSFLVEHERLELARELRSAIGPVSR